MTVIKRSKKNIILALIAMGLSIAIFIANSVNIDRSFIYRTLNWLSCQYSPVPSCLVANAIDYGMNIAEAVNTPRIHYQGLPDYIKTEPHALKPETIRELIFKGYKLVPFSPWGAAESISIDPQTKLLQGANDMRKPAGAAVAY